MNAFYDANVLYPSDLRNLLMHLALTGLFRARWSSEVHEEWIGSLLKKRPNLTREKLERTRQLMERALSDALVTGYKHRIPHLTLPDENDRHVLAAAIHAEARVIVTCNLSDFPPDILHEFDIVAQHPDDFIFQLISVAPDLVIEAAQNHRNSLNNPAKSADQYIASLQALGLTRTAAFLREHIPAD